MSTGFREMVDISMKSHYTDNVTIQDSHRPHSHFRTLRVLFRL